MLPSRKPNVKVIPSEQFNRLPYPDVDKSLGITDMRKGQSFVRQTGNPVLDQFTVLHEAGEQQAPTSPHEDVPGLRYWKPFKGDFRIDKDDFEPDSLIENTMNYLMPLSNPSFTHRVFSEDVAPYVDQGYRVVAPMAATFVGGPMAGAAMTTALQARDAADQPDSNLNTSEGWKGLGKQAAVNFGTAAAANALSNWAAPAQPASSTSMKAGFDAAQTGQAQTAGMNSYYIGGNIPAQAGTNASTAGTTMRAGFNAATAGGTASPNYGSALSRFASSGAGQALKKGAAKTGEQIVNQTLTETLQPSMAQPISDSIGTSPLSIGDVLSRFGGEELLKNPTLGGPAITQDDMNKISERISANRLLQEQSILDEFRIGGRGGDYYDDPNFKRQISEIGTSAKTAQEQAAEQANAYNKSAARMAYGDEMKRMNNLTDDQLTKYIDYARTNPTWQYANMFQPLL
jgi:hypothetical protein